METIRSPDSSARAVIEKPHPCPCCSVLVTGGVFMCTLHWRRVGQQSKDRLRRAWNALLTTASPEALKEYHSSFEAARKEAADRPLESACA